MLKKHIFFSQKAQTATIGQLSQAWAGSAHCPRAAIFEGTLSEYGLCAFLHVLSFLILRSAF